MPTARRPFKRNELKDRDSQNLFIRPKEMVKAQVIEGERRERMKRWITFYRRNPHRFISEYFGITLFPYQMMMVWVLQRSNLAYIVASRASAKTFIIAIWAMTLAVLYPGIKVVIAAKTLKQGGIALSEKLTYLRDNFPNVAREIASITTNANTYEAIFHCGSTIKVVPSSESARGSRANFLVLEESRLVPKDILEQILKPFLFSRMPPYRLKPEYANEPLLKEEGIISYITSAGFKAEDWFQNVKSCIKRMADGDETSNFLAFDYLISIYHGIKTEAMIRNEMEDNDPIGVQLEYLNIPSGSSTKAYFKSTLFRRNIKRAFYPQRADTYNPKKNPYEMKKVDGELRIISVDVATRANKTNDQSIIGCIRAIPLLGKGYERNLVYMESHKGSNTILQAKRIKEIFEDFSADFIVIDLQNAGIAIFDALSQVTISDERGINYPAMTVADSDFIDEKLQEELTGRTLGLGASPVVFPILATQNLNSQIAVAFRSSLQRKLWNFLLPDGDAEEFLLKTTKEFANDDPDTWAFYLNPYVQTGLFISECINLDMVLTNGLIKLVEKQGAYKDRYSSISYANWVISHFDKELLKETDERDSDQDWLGVTMVL